MSRHISIFVKRYLVQQSPFVGSRSFPKFSPQSLVSTHSSKMGAEDFVESTLKEKKVVVFSKSWCPYCSKAKEVFAKFKLSDKVYVVVELDKEKSDKEADEIQDYLEKKTGARFVPRVFIDGKFIGGGDDTVRLEENGELKKLLEKAGAV